MDQLLNNKWMLVGAVVLGLVVAVGLALYFKSSSGSTTAQQPLMQPPYETQQPSDAESEDESANQETEENRPPEGGEQLEGAGPA